MPATVEVTKEPLHFTSTLMSFVVRITETKSQLGSKSSTQGERNVQ